MKILSDASVENKGLEALTSLFVSAKAQSPKQVLSVADFMTYVKSGEWKSQITPLREYIAAGDRGNYGIEKGDLPAVTISCSCTSRSTNLSLEEREFVHSGWLQADFDLKDNTKLSDPAVSMAMREALICDPYVCGVFVGPSGEGIKAVVCIDPEKHKDSWLAAEAYFKERHGLNLDKSTKDPMRLCFVSYDPLAEMTEYFCNLPIPEPTEVTKSEPPLSDFPETTAEDIKEMLSFIPSRPDYYTWLRIASAVWAVMPAGEGAALLHEWSPEEKDGEYMGKYKHRLTQIGIGTLAMMAQEHGFDAKAAFRRKKKGGNIRFAKDSEPKLELETINGKPALCLPCDGHLVSQTAAGLGVILSDHGIFCRKGNAFTLDHEGQKLQLATATWLRTWIELQCVPYKVSQRNDGMQIKVKSTMPDDTAKAVLASPQFLEKLPIVERLHPCPMPWLRDNGQIELLPVGLDAESHTFTSDPGFEIVPDSIEGSRVVLDNLLGEFAWPDDGGRSMAVHISAMLTVFASGIMPQGSTRPVFLYVANAEGSGKTTLAQLAGVPYEDTPVETAPSDESEWQKKLLSAVISGRRLLLLDNVKGHLNSGALEAYTTSSHFSGRVLGGSKEFSGEAGATVLITGNGLTVTPDLRRRSLFVELFLQEMRAEDRKFRRPLDSSFIASMRREILGALWGMVKAWDEAGRPVASRHNSSFPRWIATIAGIVEFAGYGCPTAAAEIAGMGDTDTADFTVLVGFMEQGKRYTFEEVAGFAIEGGLFDRMTRDLENGGLNKSAKSSFPKLLCRYDRRRVNATGIFIVEGRGKTRRYLLSSDL